MARMLHLTPTDRELVRLASGADGVLAAQAASVLGVSRSHAGSRLRRLEHAGVLRAEVLSGGELRYRPTVWALAALWAERVPAVA